MAKSRAKTALLFGVPAILLALVFLGIGAGSRREPARAEPNTLPAAARRWERFPELIERIQEQVDRKAIAGAVVLVLHRGQPVCFEALGMADAEARTPMTRDTIFRIASMTKPITSVAAMMLVEDGELRFDDPVSKYLPEFKDMTVLVPTTGDSDKPYRLVKADRAVTIQHLLTHTSGITYRMSNRPHLGLLYTDAGISDGMVETAGTVGTNVSRLAKLPLLHQPGTAWEYGLSIDVLGRVVEVASGKTLDEFFHTRIFEPLRMRDTGFVVPKNKRSRLAALYTPDDRKMIRRVGESPVTVGSTTFSATFSTADDSRYQSGGVGLASTAGDYGRFLQMLLNHGELDGQRLLKAESVDHMTRNQIGELKNAFPIHGDGFGYGFGVVTGREKPASPASKDSYSWGGIFNTFFWVDPNEELIGLILTQLYPFDHLTLWKDFQELVYQDHKETKVSLDEPPGVCRVRERRHRHQLAVGCHPRPVHRSVPSSGLPGTWPRGAGGRPGFPKGPGWLGGGGHCKGGRPSLRARMMIVEVLTPSWSATHLGPFVA
jgi:CubicO group peptidase (beta-lactamase class C family)